MFKQVIDWFAGGARSSGHGSWNYMTLVHCMNHDWFWITVTLVLDVAVAAGYVLIARHWWMNQRRLPDVPARRALNSMRNIFVFCGVCGYLFIPVKMLYPAWRLYDMVMVVLVYFTWKYALRAKDLKVVYAELGRSTQLAADLQKSQKESSRKSQFLNALSHDLRTPLNALMLQSSVAEISAKTGDQEQLQQALTQIRGSTQAAAEMLNSLLEIARLDGVGDAPPLADFPLNDLVNEVISTITPLAQQKHLTVRTLLPEGLVVHSNRAKLQRILSNLLSNAVKFTDRGMIRVEAQRSDVGVEIHVIDTGAGVPPELQERIFDEFFQVGNHERDRSKGFGLGLAICRRLARSVGGDIALDSAPGRGSCFTLLLPFKSVQAVGGTGERAEAAAPSA